MDIVKFNDMTAIIPVKRTGVLLNKYLLGCKMGNGWKVFTSHNGKLLMNATLASLDDCKEFVAWFDSIYSEYTPIWQNYPDADIMALCRWSVKNGVDIFKVAQEESQLNLHKWNK